MVSLGIRVTALCGLILAVNAFTVPQIGHVSGLRQHSASCLPLRTTGAALSKVVRKMSDEPIYEEEEPPKPKPGKQGGLSDSMRQRLLKEGQSFGGDPNVASTNWVLVISGIIGAIAVGGTLFGAFGGGDPSSPF